MSKTTFLFVFSLLYLNNLYGQGNFGLMKINTQPIAELPRSEVFTSKKADFELPALNHRFSIMGYKPMKLDGYQVVSAHQPNSNFDIIYFIDKNGNAVRRVWATSAPHNFDAARQNNFDSLNPYGSPDMASALINGLLATIISHGFVLK